MPPPLRARASRQIKNYFLIKISLFFSKKLIVNGKKKSFLPKRLKDTLNSREKTILHLKKFCSSMLTLILCMYPKILPPIPSKYTISPFSNFNSKSSAISALNTEKDAPESIKALNFLARFGP